MASLAREQPILTQTPLKRINSYLAALWEFLPEEHETLYAPWFQFRRMYAGLPFIGDCDDAALLAAALLVPRPDVAWRFVAVRRPVEPLFSHVFLEAWEKGAPELVTIDPTLTLQNVQPDFEGWERLEMGEGR
jgi:hypothetical protein